MKKDFTFVNAIKERRGKDLCTIFKSIGASYVYWHNEMIKISKAKDLSSRQLGRVNRDQFGVLRRI